MSLLAESCGSRTPNLSLTPAGDVDYAIADGVLDWLEAIGMTLFDWQRLVLRNALARRGPKWAAYEVDLIVPRQNGKNEILIALELAATHLLGVRLVIHSAHESITSAKHFARFQELINPDSPSYLPEVDKLFPRTKTRGFYTSNGKEHIELLNGARIDFRTRTSSAGRGFSAPLVILDEAFDLPAKAVGSLQYTVRAKPNAQFWKTSSAAHPSSSVLHTDRKRAQAADPDDSRFLYMEWGNEPGCDPGDPETWLRSNPSAGLTAPGFELDLQTFRNEYASAKQDPELLAEFVREVCGVPEHPDADEARPIPLDRWAELTDAASKADRASVRLSLDAPPERTTATFAVAGKRDDNLLHGEILHHVPPADMRDLVSIARKACADFDTKLILPPGSPARAWRTEFEVAGVPIDELTPAEYAEACGYISSLVTEGTFRHRGQPELNNAVAGLGVRALGDVEVWARRKSTANIAPFVALTCALHRVPVTDVDVSTQIW